MAHTYAHLPPNTAHACARLTLVCAHASNHGSGSARTAHTGNDGKQTPQATRTRGTHGGTARAGGPDRGRPRAVRRGHQGGHLAETAVVVGRRVTSASLCNSRWGSQLAGRWGVGGVAHAHAQEHTRMRPRTRTRAPLLFGTVHIPLPFQDGAVSASIAGGRRGAQLT